MVFIRAPRIRHVGADVETLASHAGEPVLARQGSILVATFHPELTDDPTIHEYFCSRVLRAAARRFHDIYTNIPADEIDRFVRAQELGRLVTVAADGTPHLGLYPFTYDGAAFEVHLVRTDEQIADLAARPRCMFEVDEVLGTIPSYWVDPENAIMATA